MATKRAAVCGALLGWAAVYGRIHGELVGGGGQYLEAIPRKPRHVTFRLSEKINEEMNIKSKASLLIIKG